MKLELFAGILLALILIAAAGNLIVLTSLIRQITDLAQEAGRDAFDENWLEAEDAAETAMTLWTKYDVYTEIILRQSETDRVTEALGMLLSAVYNRESGTSRGAADHVTEVLEHLLESETPKAKSLF